MDNPASGSGEQPFDADAAREQIAKSMLLSPTLCAPCKTALVEAIGPPAAAGLQG